MRNTNTDTYTYAYTYTHAYTYTDADSQPNSDTYCNAYLYSNGDIYSNSHIYAYAHSNSNRDGDAKVSADTERSPYTAASFKEIVTPRSEEFATKFASSRSHRRAGAPQRTLTTLLHHGHSQVRLPAAAEKNKPL